MCNDSCSSFSVILCSNFFNLFLLILLFSLISPFFMLCYSAVPSLGLNVGLATETATNAMLEGIRDSESLKEEKLLTIREWIIAKKSKILKLNQNEESINTNSSVSNISSRNNDGLSRSNNDGINHSDGTDTAATSNATCGGSDTATTSTASSESSSNIPFAYYGGLAEPATALVIDIIDSSNYSSNIPTKKKILVGPYEGVGVARRNRSGLNPLGCSADLSQKKSDLNKIEPKGVDLNEIDLYLNTCGPIWDIAFAPDRNTEITSKCYPCTSSSSAILEKYLAVGTSRIGWPQKSSSSGNF